MFRQVKAPPGHVKERAYPKQVNQEGDVQRYGGLKAIKKDETIFDAYDKAEIPSPWHIYKDDLMKLNLQTVSLAADVMRMLNGARLSVNRLYSITGVD